MPARYVPADQENRREGLCFLNPLQIRVDVRVVARQKRERSSSQQILCGMFKELRATKALDQRIGSRVGTQKGEDFERGLEIRAFLFFAPLQFWLAHRSPASSYASPEIAV
jgi:hypothetical protein